MSLLNAQIPLISDDKQIGFFGVQADAIMKMKRIGNAFPKSIHVNSDAPSFSKSNNGHRVKHLLSAMYKQQSYCLMHVTFQCDSQYKNFQAFKKNVSDNQLYFKFKVHENCLWFIVPLSLIAPEYDGSIWCCFFVSIQKPSQEITRTELGQEKEWQHGSRCKNK
jgi:hypothetical protein